MNESYYDRIANHAEDSKRMQMQSDYLTIDLARIITWLSAQNIDLYHINRKDRDITAIKFVLMREMFYRGFKHKYIVSALGYKSEKALSKQIQVAEAYFRNKDPKFMYWYDKIHNETPR